MSVLHRKSMLVKLTISRFSNERVDVKATKEAMHQYASADNTFAPKVVKNLLPRHVLQGVSLAESALRRFHRENTMPWEDGGHRLLPAKQFMKYSQRMRELTNQFENVTRSIIDNYDHWKNIAQMASPLFNENDYPSRDALETMFQVNISFQPLPSVDDFRLDAMDAEAAELRKQMHADIQGRLSNSMATHVCRLHESLVHIKRRLDDTEALLVRTTFENLIQSASVGQSIEELMEAGTPNFCARVLEIFDKFKIDELRHNIEARKSTALLLTGVIDDIRATYPHLQAQQAIDGSDDTSGATAEPVAAAA